MGYVSDWEEAAEQFKAAHEANPLCDETLDCPAPEDGHLLSCQRWRRKVNFDRRVRQERELHKSGEHKIEDVFLAERDGCGQCGVLRAHWMPYIEANLIGAMTGTRPWFNSLGPFFGEPVVVFE